MRLVRLFPELKSITDFVIKEHPIYHPDSRDYSNYWEEQEKFCIEGKWGKDGDKYRWCPPGLYYYVNFTVIEKSKKDKSVDLIRPFLRDIDWYISYGWICARGFSGFENDEEYTCNYIVKKIEDNILLTPAETINLQNFNHIKKPDGTYKKYIDAREYLYNAHDKILGSAIYDNELKNIFLLASRSLGKSYHVANAVIGHEYIFAGKKRYSDFIDNPKGPTIFVGAAISSKSTDLLNKFEITQEYHKTHNGAWGSGEDLIPGIFHRNHVGTLVPNANKIYENAYEIREGGVVRKKGSKTNIHHGTFTTENPNAAVGKRASIIVIEEIGLVDNILKVHASNEFSQYRDGKSGSSFYLGTGGDIDKIGECKIIFENPSQYQMLEYPDLWEDRKTNIGMFIPAYYGNNLFLDQHGNTNINLAYEQELYERSVREESKNSLSLDGYKMGKPLVPSEMFMSKASFVFPVPLLRHRELELDIKKIWEKNVSIGDLIFTNEEKTNVHWVEDISKQKYSKCINTLNLDIFKSDLSGKIEVYEHPCDHIPNPGRKSSLYKVVYDPIKDDKDGTSLACVLVHKGYTDGYNEGLQNTIVAMWIGRYDQVYDAHYVAIKLALYYNAKILFENNLPHFINFCRDRNYYYKLQQTPWEAIKDAIKDPGRKYNVGVTMTAGLIENCEQLTRQYLLEPYLLTEERMLNNIDNLYSLRLIRELAAYERDDKTKFDAVSAYFILMLWLSQEKKKVYTEEDVKAKTTFKDQLNLYRNEQQKLLNNESKSWYKY